MACLRAGAVQGWGSVAFFNPDLSELEHSLANLAWSSDSVRAAFRRHYYYYAGQDFAALGSQPQTQYPVLLYFILSNGAEKLQ